MAENVNSIGVSLDSDELGDPSDNVDSPDPLIDEQPRSGALSAIGSKNDQQSRVSSAREAMQNLRSQYGAVAGQATDAYAQQKKALDDATQRLLTMQMGPSEQEAAYMRASVPGEASTGRYDPGAHNAMNASIMKQQREAEIAKQQLLTQYGMQIPQAQLGAANQRLNQITQQMRIGQSDINNASNQADKQAKPVNKYFMPDPTNPNGPPVFNQQLYDTDIQANKQKQKDNAAAKIAAVQLSAGNMDPSQIDFAATWLHDKGQMPPGYQTRMVNGQMNPVTTMVYKAMAAKYPGESASSIIANQGMVAASQGVLKDFESGSVSKQLNGLNTSVQHINVLKPVLAQLDNGQVPFINAIKNTWNQQVMGSPAPTDFNGVRDFVTGEISKAVLPNGGGEAERQALAKSAASANSGAALQSILNRWQELLAGKTNATRLQWDNGTMGRFGAFDKFLLPDTKTALGITPPAAAQPSRPGQPQFSPEQIAAAKKYGVTL
jgi:hypothetical protein